MNTEAIIEKLLLIENEQILNTPLDELDLPTRVYRPLWRSRVRTVGDVAKSWKRCRRDPAPSRISQPRMTPNARRRQMRTRGV